MLDRSRVEARAAIDKARGGVRELLLARVRIHAGPWLRATAYGLTAAALVLVAVLGTRIANLPVSSAPDRSAVPLLRMDTGLDLKRLTPGAH